MRNASFYALRSTHSECPLPLPLMYRGTRAFNAAPASRYAYSASRSSRRSIRSRSKRHATSSACVVWTCVRPVRLRTRYTTRRCPRTGRETNYLRAPRQHRLERHRRHAWLVRRRLERHRSPASGAICRVLIENAAHRRHLHEHITTLDADWRYSEWPSRRRHAHA